MCEYDEDRREVIRVKASTLDGIIDLDQLCGTLVAKIDTQGSEAHVLKGGVETLSRAEVIITEFWPYGLARMGADLEFMYGFLRKNFRYGAIVWVGDETQAPDFRDIGTVVDSLRGLGNIDKARHCDLIVCKVLPRRSQGLG